MVVYYSGYRHNIDRDLLCSIANEFYLRTAAEWTGAAIAMANARRAAIAVKMQDGSSNMDDSISSKLDSSPLPKLAADNSAPEWVIPSEKTSCVSWLWIRTKKWYNALRGGGLQIPPSMPTEQTLWTIFGAFFGLLTLSSLNVLFKYLSNEEYYLLIGPFGALMTLQYGLPSAPASQPRNAVLGQLVAGVVAMSFTYIPDNIIVPWLRQAIAPAFAIGAMVKLGIPHPPAGAHSVIYAEGNHSWYFYTLVVLCSAVSVIPATIVNNLSEKRQYPIYWGYIFGYIQRRRTEWRSPGKVSRKHEVHD